eukprot:1104014-Rhodomonas_salina.3
MKDKQPTVEHNLKLAALTAHGHGIVAPPGSCNHNPRLLRLTDTVKIMTQPQAPRGCDRAPHRSPP